jgi:uncharacterized protein with HEPN domain
MPERDVSLLLEDILESIDKIDRYTGLTYRNYRI